MMTGYTAHAGQRDVSEGRGFKAETPAVVVPPSHVSWCS